MSLPNVRMGKISYINASPVYYGLDHGLTPAWLSLVPDVPSALNRMIKAGDIDISPISSAYYAMNHRELLLLPDLSISCHGPVMSVICASNHPLEDLTGRTVLFSQESASSSSFLKMIFARQRIEPVFRVGPVGNIRKIDPDADAVLVIGDAALTQPWASRFRHVFDLGQVWFDMTGLPFVFAVWVVRRSFADKYPERVTAAWNLLRASRAAGDAHMDEIIADGGARLGLSLDRVREYYDLLLCDLDPAKVEGMGLFFDGLYRQNILTDPVNIRFFS